MGGTGGESVMPRRRGQRPQRRRHAPVRAPLCPRRRLVSPPVAPLGKRQPRALGLLALTKDHVQQLQRLVIELPLHAAALVPGRTTGRHRTSHTHAVRPQGARNARQLRARAAVRVVCARAPCGFGGHGRSGERDRTYLSAATNLTSLSARVPTVEVLAMMSARLTLLDRSRPAMVAAANRDWHGHRLAPRLVSLAAGTGPVTRSQSPHGWQSGYTSPLTRPRRCRHARGTRTRRPNAAWSAPHASPAA